MADLIAWMVSFFLLIGVLGLICYQLMSLGDLEFDYINPYDLADRVNDVVIPEFVTHGLFSFLHLVTGHWFMFLCCTPYLYHNYRLYTKRRHLIDVTEIFNHLSWEIKSRIYKIVYLIVTLCVSIFWMIWTIVHDQGSDLVVTLNA